MKNLLTIIALLTVLASCKKEKLSTETTFSYVASVTDSIYRSTTLDYSTNYYFYNNGWITKDSIFRRTTGGILVYNFQKVGNVLNRFFYSSKTNIYNFNANGILTHELDSLYHYDNIFTYDSQDRLLFVNTIYLRSPFTSFDTLTWLNNNLTRKRTLTINYTSYIENEYNYLYDNNKINNLRNKYLGFPLKGFDDYSNSENICTAFTHINRQYSASSPIPAITINNYTLDYTFDAKNRISTITIHRNGLFYNKLRYTYYE